MLLPTFTNAKVARKMVYEKTNFEINDVFYDSIISDVDKYIYIDLNSI